MTKILLIEDENSLATGLVDVLRVKGYQVDRESRGDTGLEAVQGGDYDLLILDVELPGLSGLEVLKNLRQEGSEIRILMLSARSGELDKVIGLEYGADDYVSKPFSLAELLGRVKALLRRSVGVESPVPSDRRSVHFGDVKVDLQRFKIHQSGQEMPSLPAKAFAVLDFLLQKRGQVVSRDELIDAVWGEEECITQRTLNNLVVKIRQAIEKLPEEPSYLKTVHGVGYRLEA